MKRLALLLLLCLLFACSTKTPSEDSSARLFFPNAEFSANSPVSPQAVALPEVSAEALMALYNSVEPDAAHRTAIPGGWHLSDVKVEEGTAVVRFFGAVCPSAEASLTYACLAQTLLQADGVQQFRFYSPNDPNGLLLTPADILLTDLRSEIQEEDLVLYLPKVGGYDLERTIRTVPVMDAADKPAYLISQLIESGRLPAGTALRGIRTDYGVCTVDLSEDFVTAMPPTFTAERLSVYSIVNSLTTLDSVYRVELKVEGSPLTHLKYLSFSGELTRDETLFPPEAHPDALETCLYLVCSSSGKLVPIPYTLSLEPDTPAAATLLQALLSAQGRDGILNVLPSNLRILSLKVEDGTCVLDVTGEFMDGGPTTQVQQLRSLIATLSNLKEVSRVVVYVEGIEPEYSQPGLSEIKRTEADWFAEIFAP